jgi:hypothetical protein
MMWIVAWRIACLPYRDWPPRDDVPKPDDARKPWCRPAFRRLRGKHTSRLETPGIT